MVGGGGSDDRVSDIILTLFLFTNYVTILALVKHASSINLSLSSPKMPSISHFALRTLRLNTDVLSMYYLNNMGTL